MNVAVAPIQITRPDPAAPILIVTPANLAIRAGTVIDGLGPQHIFEHDTPVETISRVPGQDYGIRVAADDGRPIALPVSASIVGDGVTFAGFHFAPGGNATARAGGDTMPAINPLSCWDQGFRPACPDPRGMTLVTMPDGKRIWVDIYKLGVEHLVDGTSHHGATIADGWKNLPQKPTGKGKVKALDFATATAIYAHHGKQLLSYDEFRAAAFGVTERTSASSKPTTAGLDAPRTSACGVMQATGNLYDWGTDGDPDDPRPSIFGGYWSSGVNAGSRYADLVSWAGDSGVSISARGRSDHL